MGNTLQKPQLKQTELTEPHDSIFTCEICIEPFLSTTHKFKNKNLCTHPFCVDCMIKYIQQKLQDNVAIIPCPALHCNKRLDPISTRPFLPPKIFNKWCDSLCYSTLLGIQRCYCPYENCSVLVINECGIVKKSECPNCKRWFCFKCMQKWHGGFRCEESVLVRDVIEQEKWMRCRRCRHFVERIDGCKFIKCRCDASFCYACGKYAMGRSCECGIVFLRWWLIILAAIMFFMLIYITLSRFNMVYGSGKIREGPWESVKRSYNDACLFGNLQHAHKILLLV